MSTISGLSSSLQSILLQELSSTNSTSTSSSTTGSQAADSASSTAISQPGKLLSELQQLSQSNPTAFKAVATQLATVLKNAASNATGGDAKMLSSLATSLSDAAKTGTLSLPKPAGQGSGGPPPGGGGGGPSSTVQTAFADALKILEQTLDGTSTSSSTTASDSTSTVNTTT